MIKTKKTLKVLLSDSKHNIEVSSPTRQKHPQSKPLGFDRLSPRYVSTQFSNFFNAYARTINKADGRTGSLFEHPFERVPIISDRQFWNVIAYIHQNHRSTDL